jgi:HAMP domain-containing protein
MPRIEIDFIRRAPRSRWTGRVLLACALALAGDMTARYVRLEHAVQADEALLARAQPGRNARPVSADELAAARDTLSRLALPWSRLFSALEAAATDQVALLAIEPDTKAGTVKISGDSKDYLAALSYVLNLSQTPALSNVQLVRHEVKQNDPQHAVAFSISAAWDEGKR